MNDTATGDPWLTASQAADYLKQHPETMRDRFRRGDIKAVKRGKPWYTKASWCDDYVMRGAA